MRTHTYRVCPLIVGLTFHNCHCTNLYLKCIMIDNWIDSNNVLYQIVSFDKLLSTLQDIRKQNNINMYSITSKCRKLSFSLYHFDGASIFDYFHCFYSFLMSRILAIIRSFRNSIQFSLNNCLDTVLYHIHVQVMLFSEFSLKFNNYFCRVWQLYSIGIVIYKNMNASDGSQLNSRI